MTRFSKLAAALAVLPVLAISGSAHAGSPGQLAQGSGLYQVKNLTQNGAYNSTISATCNDEVVYSMELANTGFGSLNNVTIKSTLPSNGGTSATTVTTDTGGLSGTHDSVTVNLGSGQTQTYEAGSTTLYDNNGKAVKTLADGITAGGLNLGTIAGSTTEFVNFKAKVSCPVTPPPVVAFACTGLGVKQVDRTHYDFTATATASNATVQSYTFTAVDSNNKTVNTSVVNTSALSAVYHFNQETGTYTVSVVVKTDKGSTKGFDCSKQITVVATPPTTPTPPATPPTTSLPDTGAGGIVGIFAGASAAGTAAHAVISRRRRN